MTNPRGALSREGADGLERVRPTRTERALPLAALVAFLLLAVITLVRAQLWAEEATVYLPAGILRGWHGIFDVHQGYLALVPNLAGIMAAALPLGGAGMVFGTIGLLSQLLLFATIYLLPECWGHRPWGLAAMIVLLTLLPDASLWLNSLGAIFHVAAAWALIACFAKPERRAAKAGVVAVAVLAALTSPPAYFVVPIVIVRAFREKGIWRVVLAVFLVGAAIQAVAHWSQPDVISRGSEGVVIAVKNALLWTFVEPVLGVGSELRASSPMLYRLLAGVTVLATAVVLAIGPRSRAEVYGLIAIAGLALGSSLFGLAEGGVRYLYPAWPLLLAILIPGAGLRGLHHRASAALLVLMAAGQLLRADAERWTRHDSWRNEVAQARASGITPPGSTRWLGSAPGDLRWDSAGLDATASPMTRVVITGAAGMLGKALTRILTEDGVSLTGWAREDLDVTDRLAVMTAISAARPELIFHCAAFTDVDGAEAAETAAREVNAGGTANIVDAADSVGARVVHFSTDYVFNGRTPDPIRPDAHREPQSVYGRTKSEAEDAVLSSSGLHLIVRTSWLFGAGGRNFVDTMTSLAARDRLKVVADQTGRPTWTMDLARAAIDLAATDARGTFHIANQGHTTWAGLAETLFQWLGASVVVEPVSTEAWGAAAPRPLYSVLDLSATEEVLGRPMPHWKDALAAHLRETGVTFTRKA